MKIRILGNSIRLRLSQGDIKQLENLGRIVETINFPNGEVLRYSLNKNEAEQIKVDFQDGEVKTSAPLSILSEWINTDRVGFEKELPLEEGNSLKILVEKDFKCLTDRAEDESDLFPHPKEDEIDC